MLSCLVELFCVVEMNSYELLLTECLQGFPKYTDLADIRRNQVHHEVHIPL
jgi:hypothetical protein